jgi:hypothetical protein
MFDIHTYIITAAVQAMKIRMKMKRPTMDSRNHPNPFQLEQL